MVLYWGYTIVSAKPHISGIPSYFMFCFIYIKKITKKGEQKNGYSNNYERSNPRKLKR